MLTDRPQETRIPGTTTVLRSWRNAIVTIFFICGISFATWVTRLPSIRDELGLSTAEVGGLVFALAGGGIVGLLTAPPVMRRLGPRTGLAVATGCLGPGLIVVGGGVWVGATYVTVLGLVVLGFAYGGTDVVMNVDGAAVERSLGTTLMPFFHGAFSLGTVVGALLGAALSGAGISVQLHFTMAGMATVAVAVLACRFIPGPQDEAGRGASARGSLQSAARPNGLSVVFGDKRLWLISVVVLGMAFAEGSGNDWIALAAVDGHEMSHTRAAVVYGVFVSAMAMGRVFGGPVLDRFGRTRVLGTAAIVGVFGLLTFMNAPTTWSIYAGAALWGLGGSLGFPVGMSAAADHPTHGAERVSAVAICGYAAFLIGPPIVGFLGERYGLLDALYLIVGLLLLSALASPAIANPPSYVISRRQG